MSFRRTLARGIEPSASRSTNRFSLWSSSFGLDNAMMESFWSSMQIELLDRKKWKTRLELANAIFDYIEIFHNRQRRHSSLGYRTPIEFELLSEKTPITAAS